MQLTECKWRQNGLRIPADKKGQSDIQFEYVRKSIGLAAL